MIFLNERDEIDLLTGSGGEDGRGCAWTGPILSSLIITREKRCYPLSMLR